MDVISVVDKAVSQVFEINPIDLHGTDRRRKIVDGRHFSWFFLRSFFGVDTKDIAVAYNTTQRNIFYGYSIIRDGVNNHPFYITYYKEIEAVLKKDGCRMDSFKPLATSASFIALSPGVSIPIWTSKGFSIPLNTRRLREDGSIVYGTGLSINIPIGYIGLLFVRNTVRPIGKGQKTKVEILESGDSGEIKVTFKEGGEDFLKGVENGHKVAHLVTIRIPEI